MRKLKLIRLTPILLILFGVTVIRSQETQPTPTMPSVPGSPEIRVVETGVCDTVTDCIAKLETANRRLQKALDAYDHAILAGNAKGEVIEAYKILKDLMKEGMAIKDQFIADLKADNDFLRKTKIPKAKSAVRKVLEKAWRIIIFAAGVYAGRA